MEKEFNAIKNFLDKHGVEYTVYEHEPVYTSEQAAAVRGFDLKSGVKSLVFRVETKATTKTEAQISSKGVERKSSKTEQSSSDSSCFILALVSGDRKIDNKKLAAVVNANNVKLATPDEVLKRAGCEIGSVHPFGNLAGLETYMDKRILENKIIAFNAGLHTITITMKSEDFVHIVKPEIVDIAKV
jgi:Ala-tRNA(Pro) deacylase